MSDNCFIYLFEGVTSNTTTAAQQLSFGKKKAVLKVWGKPNVGDSWDGATVTIQTSTVADSDGNFTWITVRDEFNITFTFTADTQITLKDFVFNEEVRAVIANAGDTTNLNCTIQVT